MGGSRFRGSRALLLSLESFRIGDGTDTEGGRSLLFCQQVNRKIASSVPLGVPRMSPKAYPNRITISGTKRPLSLSKSQRSFKKENTNAIRNDQGFLDLFLNAAKPTSPAPKSSNVPGSGTGAATTVPPASTTLPPASNAKSLPLKPS